MPKNKKSKQVYNKICSRLQDDAELLNSYKIDSMNNKNLLEDLTCDAMGWTWLWEDNIGWDALGAIHKELKNQCFTGNALEGTGKISGKGKFMNVNAYNKIKSFMYDPADLVFPLWVYGTLEAVIEVKPLDANDRTQTRPANWILTLRNKSMKALNIHTVQELRKACTGDDRPQMSSPTIMMKDWIDDDYTVTLLSDELTEHAYTPSILKILHEAKNIK